MKYGALCEKLKLKPESTAAEVAARIEQIEVALAKLAESPPQPYVKEVIKEVVKEVQVPLAEQNALWQALAPS